MFTPTYSNAKTKKQLKKLYVTILPIVKKAALKLGYAIGVHGSLTRDLDLIAIPWVENCSKPELLVYSIAKKVCKYNFYPLKEIKKHKTKKPHRRDAYAIMIGQKAYIDLSIIKPYFKN